MIVEEDIAAECKRQGNNPRDLLQLPKFVKAGGRGRV